MNVTLDDDIMGGVWLLALGTATVIFTRQICHAWYDVFELQGVAWASHQ